MNRIAATQDWLRRNLFSDAFSGLTTLALLAGALYWLPGLIDWMLLRAVFKPDAAACHALNHGGACWGVGVWAAVFGVTARRLPTQACQCHP